MSDPPNLKALASRGGALARTEGRPLRYCGKTTLVDLPFGRVVALVDGTIVFLVGLNTTEFFGTEAVYEVTPKEALRISDAIECAAFAARERIEKLSGANLWHHVRTDGDRVLMRYRKAERLFRPSKVGKKRPRSWMTEERERCDTCDSCKALIRVGELVYREVEPEPVPGRYDDNFDRRTRLCPACVAPREGGLVAIEGGTKT